MKKQRSSINFLMGVILYNLVMDFPEPLSGMLRNFDWDAYLATAQPIPLRSIQRNATPYLITNETGTIKVIGFLIGDIYSNNLIPNNVFDLHFAIDETGNLSRTAPSVIHHAIAYVLPEIIRNEMILVNTIYYHLFAYNHMKQNQLIADIRHLVELNKTDYLKITYFASKSNLLLIVMSLYGMVEVFKELIKHYSVEDLKYRNLHGETVLDHALSSNLPVYAKIIEDSIKEKELENFLYVSKKTGLTAENIDELSNYFINNKKGGKTKSKRRRNNRRNTRKHK